MAVQKDPTAELMAKLDAMANQAYLTVRMMRTQGNLLRALVVDAKQTVRRLHKLDVEL